MIWIKIHAVYNITSTKVSSPTVCNKQVEEAIEWGSKEEAKEGVHGKRTPHWADISSSSWRVTTSFPSSLDFRYCCWVGHKKNGNRNIVAELNLYMWQNMNWAHSKLKNIFEPNPICKSQTFYIRTSGRLINSVMSMQSSGKLRIHNRRLNKVTMETSISSEFSY